MYISGLSMAIGSCPLPLYLASKLNLPTCHYWTLHVTWQLVFALYVTTKLNLVTCSHVVSLYLATQTDFTIFLSSILVLGLSRWPDNLSSSCSQVTDFPSSRSHLTTCPCSLHLYLTNHLYQPVSIFYSRTYSPTWLDSMTSVTLYMTCATS